jgi:hypothetical protein
MGRNIQKYMFIIVKERCLLFERTMKEANKILEKSYKFFSKKNKEKHKIKIKMIEDHYNKIVGVNERSNCDNL